MVSGKIGLELNWREVEITKANAPLPFQRVFHVVCLLLHRKVTIWRIPLVFL